MNYRSSRLAAAHDLKPIDLFAFAHDEQKSSGELPLTALPRLSDVLPSNAPEHNSALRWTAAGAIRSELTGAGGGRAVPYLQITLNGALWLECQRCLTLYPHRVSIDARYRIVASNEEADAAPLDADYDVLIGSHPCNLIDLIDEELLLSLPLAPKHRVCPTVHKALVSGPDGGGRFLPQAGQAENAAEDSAQARPFAALKDIWRKR